MTTTTTQPPRWALVFGAGLTAPELVGVSHLQANADGSVEIHRGLLGARTIPNARVEYYPSKSEAAAAQRQQLATGVSNDPGSDRQGAIVSSEARLQTQWDGMSKDQRMGFCNDFGAFKAWTVNAHLDGRAAPSTNTPPARAKES